MKSVSIIGSHPRTRADFDFSRTDCDVWLFNEAISNKANTWAKRADVVFQMHSPVIWTNPNNRNDPGHFEWLKTQADVKQIYMQDVYSEVPASVKYPLDEVLQMLGGDADHFLSSSVAQAIALAIYQKYEQILIYGVAMESGTEYQFQREGVAFWKGFAMGRGIEVTFADPTFNCLLYGYEGAVEIEYKKFAERVAQLTPEAKTIEAEFIQCKQGLAKSLDTFYTDSSVENEKDLFEKVEQARRTASMLGMLDGAMQENGRYQSKADTMKSVSGDFTFSRQEFETSAQNMTKASFEADTNVTVIGAQLDIVHNGLRQSAKDSPKRKKILATYYAKLQEYIEQVNKAGIYKGAMNENYAYMSQLDKSIRAAGGSKSAEVMLDRR